MVELRGIWGFPLTPFAGDDIDLDALSAGVTVQLRGGVDVLCACGAIAQTDQLRLDERLACAREVVKAAGGAVPVLAAVPTSEDDARLSEALVNDGIDGLLVVPSTPDPATVHQHLRAIADAVPGVPLTLYHRPPLRLGPDAAKRLCDIEELVSIKDGHRDVRLFRQLRWAIGTRLLWVSAWEDVAPAFWAMGAEAFCPFTTAYAPEYSRAWLTCLRQGDLEQADRLLAAHSYPMVDLRLSRPDIDVAAVKAGMRARGVPAGGIRQPAQPLTAVEENRVDRLVTDLDSALAAYKAQDTSEVPRTSTD